MSLYYDSVPQDGQNLSHLSGWISTSDKRLWKQNIARAILTQMGDGNLETGKRLLMSKFAPKSSLQPKDIDQLLQKGSILSQAAKVLDKLLFPNVPAPVFAPVEDTPKNFSISAEFSRVADRLAQQIEGYDVARLISEVNITLEQMIGTTSLNESDLERPSQYRLREIRTALGIAVAFHYRDLQGPLLSSVHADPDVPAAKVDDDTPPEEMASFSAPTEPVLPATLPAENAFSDSAAATSPTTRILRDNTHKVVPFGHNGTRRIASLIEEMERDGAENVALGLLQSRLTQIRRIHGIEHLPASSLALEFPVPKAPSFLHIKQIEAGRLPELTQKDAEILDAFFTKAFYKSYGDTYRASESNHPPVADIMLAYRTVTSGKTSTLESGVNETVALR